MRQLRRWCDAAYRRISGSPDRITTKDLRQAGLVTLGVVVLSIAVSFSNGVFTDVETAAIRAMQTATAVASPAATPGSTPQPSPEASTTPQASQVTTATPQSNRPQQSSRGGATSRGARTIVIDPGHGGSENGATKTMPNGTVLREKDLTLKVCETIAQILRSAGHNVILTRTRDTLVNASLADLTGNGKVDVSDDLQARVDLANREKADLFVSVHFNAGNASSRGTEVFYNADRPFAEQSLRLATSIYNALLRAVRAENYNVVGRGVKPDAQATGGAPFFVLGPRGGYIVRAGQMPAALGEALFLSYPAEAELLADSSFLATLGRAYADGILNYISGD